MIWVVNQPCFQVFDQLESLLLKSLRGENTNEEMTFVNEKYASDIDVEQLEVELKTFEVMFEGKNVICLTIYYNRCNGYQGKKWNLLET